MASPSWERGSAKFHLNETTESATLSRHTSFKVANSKNQKVQEDEALSQEWLMENLTNAYQETKISFIRNASKMNHLRTLHQQHMRMS